MLVKTSDLIGPALELAVAKCEGYDCQFDDEVSGPWLVPQEGYLHDEKPLGAFCYSTNWSQGGPIIEHHSVGVAQYGPQDTWKAAIGIIPYGCAYGDTPLIAAMRAYVASRLGDEVEVPDELMEKQNAFG